MWVWVYGWVSKWGERSLLVWVLVGRGGGEIKRGVNVNRLGYRFVTHGVRQDAITCKGASWNYHYQVL